MQLISNKRSSLVFSSSYDGISLIIQGSGTTWIAYYRNTPTRVFTTRSQEGVLGYLQLLFITKKGPFRDDSKWIMRYEVDGKDIISSTFLDSLGRERPKMVQADTYISVFKRIAKSGLSLLESNAAMEDVLVKDAPSTMPR